MTFCEKLHAYLLEEYKDVVKYNELVVTAPPELKPIIKDMAKEEWTHAEHIKTMLHDLKSCLTKEEQTVQDEAKNSMNGGV